MFDIGSSLREARLRQELDFPELEERTKIRPKYLRALEDERFDLLPAPTYVKGFLRSYAEALGLDGQPFVDEYNSRFTVGEDDAPLRARRVPPPRHVRGPRESRIAAVALAAIAIARPSSSRRGSSAARKARRSPDSSPDHPRPRRRSRPKGTARLVVRASDGSSWMEVRETSSAGKLLYSGTLEGGQRKSFEGKSLQLALAKPHNVLVRLNGNRVELPKGTTFVVTSQRIVRATS